MRNEDVKSFFFLQINYNAETSIRRKCHTLLIKIVSDMSDKMANGVKNNDARVAVVGIYKANL